MRLADFDTLTFDCYGTLIDWETGIAAALEPLAARTGREIAAEERIAAFGRHEHDEQARTPGALYPEILAGVHAAIAREWGLDPDPGLARAFGDSVPEWPAFPDSAAALRYLKRHFRLVILSNVHRAGFAASNEKLEVEFDAIYTAEDIGSYKPDPRNFHYMLENLERDFGVAKERDPAHRGEPVPRLRDGPLPRSGHRLDPSAGGGGRLRRDAGGRGAAGGRLLLHLARRDGGRPPPRDGGHRERGEGATS